jgi:hypothetical protein|tara:strand:+ start:69 stop:491 length:423 start_codon:yes stop_codon:yes gene_type:complete
MAHFAKLDDNNKVLTVHVIDNVNAPSEEAGIEFLTNQTGYTNWKQTSYNTFENIHYSDGDKTIPSGQPAFRGNFAQIGGTYDPVNDMFFPLKTFASFVKNTTNAKWDCPVAKPSDYNTVLYGWDEENQEWVPATERNPQE